MKNKRSILLIVLTIVVMFSVGALIVWGSCTILPYPWNVISTMCLSLVVGLAGNRVLNIIIEKEGKN